MAIVRVVLFRANPGTADALAKQLAQNLRDLRPHVTGVIDMVTGPVKAGNIGYDCAVTVKYEDQAALDAYDANPAHHGALDKVKPYVADRHFLVYETLD